MRSHDGTGPEDSERRREAAETSRLTHEDLRQAAEEERQIAEEQRQATEEARQAAVEQRHILKEMRETAREIEWGEPPSDGDEAGRGVDGASGPGHRGRRSGD